MPRVVARGALAVDLQLRLRQREVLLEHEGRHREGNPLLGRPGAVVSPPPRGARGERRRVAATTRVQLPYVVPVYTGFWRMPRRVLFAHRRFPVGVGYPAAVSRRATLLSVLPGSRYHAKICATTAAA